MRHEILDAGFRSSTGLCAAEGLSELRHFISFGVGDGKEIGGSVAEMADVKPETLGGLAAITARGRFCLLLQSRLLWILRAVSFGLQQGSTTSHWRFCFSKLLQQSIHKNFCYSTVFRKLPKIRIKWTKFYKSVESNVLKNISSSLRSICCKIVVLFMSYFYMGRSIFVPKKPKIATRCCLRATETKIRILNFEFSVKNLVKMKEVLRYEA